MYIERYRRIKLRASSCDTSVRILGENADEDIKTTIMDPNTRTLIRVQISDIENDMQIFQLLRGKTPTDLINRRQMMRDFIPDINDIDT